MPEINYKELFKNHTATIEKCGLLTRIIFQKPNSNLHKITYTFMEDQSTLVVTGDCKPLVATNVSNFGKPETLYNSLFKIIKAETIDKALDELKPFFKH